MRLKNITLSLSFFDTVLIGVLIGLIGVLAQIKFNLGPIPYTMQNMGVVITSILLTPYKAFLTILLYLFLIGIGLPLASGFMGGPLILFGYTSGYLWGFLVSAPLFSYASRKFLKNRKKGITGIQRRDVYALLGISFLCFLPVYVLGFIVFLHYAVSSEALASWAQNVAGFIGMTTNSRLFLLFLSSVLIFIPQDLFMDHLIGIYIAKEISVRLEKRGINIE